MIFNVHSTIFSTGEQKIRFPLDEDVGHGPQLLLDCLLPCASLEGCRVRDAAADPHVGCISGGFSRDVDGVSVDPLARNAARLRQRRQLGSVGAETASLPEGGEAGKNGEEQSEGEDNEG